MKFADMLFKKKNCPCCDNILDEKLILNHNEINFNRTSRNKYKFRYDLNDYEFKYNFSKLNFGNIIFNNVTTVSANISNNTVINGIYNVLHNNVNNIILSGTTNNSTPFITNIDDTMTINNQCYKENYCIQKCSKKVQLTQICGENQKIYSIGFVKRCEECIYSMYIESKLLDDNFISDEYLSAYETMHFGKQDCYLSNNLIENRSYLSKFSTTPPYKKDTFIGKIIDINKDIFNRIEKLSNLN